MPIPVQTYSKILSFCDTIRLLDTFILFIHYNQFIYYLVQRLGLTVFCFRCLTDTVALRLSKFY